MSSVHVPFGMGERERGGGGDDDAAVWRGENRKRAAKHGEARVELRKQLPGERGRTGDACTALLGGLARDDVLPGSLSAGSRVSGSDELRFQVERGVRMCMYLFDCFLVAVLRCILLRAERRRWMEGHVRWLG